MSSKIHKTVVRNAAYRVGEFNIRQRHNDRQNESYHNGDIDMSRSHLNYYYYYDPFLNEATGIMESNLYEHTFNRLLEEGKIVKRGLKADAKVFDELIFDVNSAYFEENGGYEFAKSFFKEAYNYAVKEIGGEDYVISAVLHADEKNKSLSDELGRDVYHYHLHVVYVPVVQKQVFYSKRAKEKAGTLKEVIPQISHSKKWPMRVPVERNGKTVMLNSYSLLQDRFYEHMKAAGFDGFERGERGSTAEHLSDLEYKTKMEAERLAEKTAQVNELEQTVNNISDELLGRQFAVQHYDSIIKDKFNEANNLETKTHAKAKELADISSVVKVKQQTLASLDSSINEKENSATTLAKEVEAKKKELTTIKKEITTAQGKVLASKDIAKIPVKISRPILGRADNHMVTLSKCDWDDVKKTALTNARKEEDYKAATKENAQLKKDNAELLNVGEQLLKDKEGLEKRNLHDALAKSKTASELHNLQHAVNKIPKDIWDMYTKPATQQKKRQEVR